jgi:hypothetical protein
MRAPSSADLLDAWERALSAPRALRALRLIAAASADESLEAIGELSIGERDRRLLTLREWTFGPTLDSVADCAACGERLEWTVLASDLRAPDSDPACPDLALDLSPYRVRFRLPNSHDLAALDASTEDSEGAADRLFERCVLHAERADEPVAAAALPPDIRDAIGARMAAADANANNAFDLTCPACAHQWRVAFDIESFFWRELTAWAERVLHEVHTIACAYGWREGDILNLSPRRRQFYLALIGV